jgi:peptide/bleomycin uptake transporter|tara:strand:- start:1015 stop:2010 length:996 start_codon:yes stop_codon:yes gene_type:complete
MFKFFYNPSWFLWAYLGSATILIAIWLQVQIDVEINYWFGDFYDLIQVALNEPNSITMEEYFGSLLVFGKFAAMWIALSLFSSFFTSHFLFRWRTSMVDYYHSVYDKARQIEGASQRVQEDTIKFSRIMESLGTSFFEAVLLLFEFFPILMTLSIGLPILWFGEWEYGLVTGAFVWSVGGTLFMILLAWILKLVGIEYDLQKKEAAYRKILVIAEDDGSVRPKSLEELFDGVRKIHFKSYLNYLFFNIGRLAYLQANVLSAYILIAPAIVAGIITLGVMQQLIRAFGKVEGSLQYLFQSWPTLIELASVFKRLREFEKQIDLVQLEESSKI